jgi:hypothetical protein
MSWMVFDSIDRRYACHPSVRRDGFESSLQSGGTKLSKKSLFIEAFFDLIKKRFFHACHPSVRRDGFESSLQSGGTKLSKKSIFNEAFFSED